MRARPGSSYTDRDSHELRAALAREPGVRPPASPEAVAAIEQKLTVALPDDYKRFLLEVSDGGVNGRWPVYGTEALALLASPVREFGGDPGPYAPALTPDTIGVDGFSGIEIAHGGCDVYVHLELANFGYGTLVRSDLTARPMFSRLVDRPGLRLDCDVRRYLRDALGLDPDPDVPRVNAVAPRQPSRPEWVARCSVPGIADALAAAVGALRPFAIAAPTRLTVRGAAAGSTLRRPVTRHLERMKEALVAWGFNLRPPHHDLPVEASAATFLAFYEAELDRWSHSYALAAAMGASINSKGRLVPLSGLADPFAAWARVTRLGALTGSSTSRELNVIEVAAGR
jgi:hypothetical protein